MTAPRVVNPESTVLQQVEGYWQKIATLILWKCKGREVVKVTAEDMKAFEREFAAVGGGCLFTHGHVDSLEFGIVTGQDAERIAAHDSTMRGRA